MLQSMGSQRVGHNWATELNWTEKVKIIQLCLTLATPQTVWNSPGKNTGVGSHFLLQGIFPTQGSNPGLLHCKQILYHLSHQGSPPSNLEGLIPPRSSMNLIMHITSPNAFLTPRNGTGGIWSKKQYLKLEAYVSQRCCQEKNGMWN